MRIARRSTEAFIDTDGLLLDKHKDLKDPLERQFRITPFTLLSEINISTWNAAFGSVTAFFGSLNPDVQIRLGTFYVNARRRLSDASGISDASTLIADAFRVVAEETSLLFNLLRYITHKSNISLPAQTSIHGDRLVMRRTDYSLFLSLGFLSKMMIPIWGEMLLPVSGGLENMTGILACFDTILPVLKEHSEYRSLITRLESYVSDLITEREPFDIRTSLEETPSYDLSRLVLATLVVKHYGNVVLDAPKCSDWFRTYSRIVVDTWLTRRLVRCTHQQHESQKEWRSDLSRSPSLV